MKYLYKFCPLFQRQLHIKVILVGQMVSGKMFEKNNHIHVYTSSRGSGADNPLGNGFPRGGG